MEKCLLLVTTACTTTTSTFIFTSLGTNQGLSVAVRYTGSQTEMFVSFPLGAFTCKTKN